MTLSHVPPFWKEAPFIRLLIPLLLGIVLQQECPVPSVLIWVILISCLAFLLFFNRLPHFLIFRFNWIRGIIIHLLVLVAGYLIAFANDGTTDGTSLLNCYRTSSVVRVTIQQPLEEKINSYRSIASADCFYDHDSLHETNGNLIIYFSKKEIGSDIGYGTQLLISKRLERIKNSGNPGAFDYEKYCRRQHIYYSVFLSGHDYRIIKGTNSNPLESLLFAFRKKILDVLTLYIPSKKESGFAKALLIGYTDDLDRGLVQSYSNTGVVHIIAISGLHLGIIFSLLDLLVSPLKKKKYSRWIAFVIILVGLWGFSILAGGGPSVIRSAFMFSFVLLGKAISKQSNILNNLAASAFILLCIHPFWFWDLGFQLSYAAVLSIVLFFKPIYNCFYFPNKIVDFTWKLSAVTLSAQILTVPICIYQFHQLPMYFLISNLLAVPWSSLILLGEILLCCIAFLPSLAFILGLGLQWVIFALNDYIERINSLPFSVWTPLQISTFQLLLIFVFILTISLYLMQKKNHALITALITLLLFVATRSYILIEASFQKRIIVYYIPHANAIDLVNGRTSVFIGDEAINADKQITRLYLQPARSLYHLLPSEPNIHMQKSNSIIFFYGRLILVPGPHINVPLHSTPVDLLILSNDVRVDLRSFVSTVRPKLVVADASNHNSRRNEWRQICATLRIPFHDVTTDGALQYDLN